MMLPGSVSGGFQGSRATYVALCAVSTLALALLISLWHSTVSSAIAVLGLLAIYMASSEILVLFFVFAPISVLVDIIRLSATRGHMVHGRGWLVFFTVLEMIAKLAGAVFAWSLHKSLSSGETTYQPMNTPPPPPAAPAPVQYTSAADPFAAYQPPRNDGMPPMAAPMSSSYQPFPAPTSAPTHTL